MLSRSISISSPSGNCKPGRLGIAVSPEFVSGRRGDAKRRAKTCHGAFHARLT
jgi:hypothetical protein